MLLNYKNMCKAMRRDIIRMTHNAGSIGAHAGGSLSLVEIFAVLYTADGGLDPSNIKSEQRPRIILSKGHGVMAQYAAMKQVGILRDEQLDTFKCMGSALAAHPHMNEDIGIEFSSGSLGQGLSQGVGVALSLKRKHNDAKVYVIVGDGECDEGSIWEAAMSAAHFKLDNLCVVVDKNNIQYDGRTNDVMSLEDIESKFGAFGFDTVKVDGHSCDALVAAFGKKSSLPKAVIAETVKGKGVSFMENEPKWHNGRLDKELFDKAMAELEG